MDKWQYDAYYKAIEDKLECKTFGELLYKDIIYYYERDKFPMEVKEMKINRLIQLTDDATALNHFILPSQYKSCSMSMGHDADGNHKVIEICTYKPTEYREFRNLTMGMNTEKKGD